MGYTLRYPTPRSYVATYYISARCTNALTVAIGAGRLKRMPPKTRGGAYRPTRLLSYCDHRVSAPLPIIKIRCSRCQPLRGVGRTGRRSRRRESTPPCGILSPEWSGTDGRGFAVQNTDALCHIRGFAESHALRVSMKLQTPRDRFSPTVIDEPYRHAKTANHRHGPARGCCQVDEHVPTAEH